MKIFGQFLVGQRNPNSPFDRGEKNLWMEVIRQSESGENKSGKKPGKYFLDAKGWRQRRILRGDFF
ncbi:MAG: hypothetical protein ABI387_05870 [Lacunisphaera sp.]